MMKRAYNYPYTAIEEVLSNAVYHKSHDDRNPIEVRIEPNSIIVYSLASPMPPITNEDLQKENRTNTGQIIKKSALQIPIRPIFVIRLGFEKIQ